MISSSLIQNLRQQVMQRLPFSGMAVADVDFFIQSSSEVYCAPNEVILSPADGPPACLYLIRQGRVSGKRTAPGLSDTAFELEAGELFSVSASLAARPVAATYVAIGDCFCLTLPAADMQTLVGRSKPFRDFINNRVWMLLEQSRQALRNNFASKALLEQSLETRLGELIRRAPVTSFAQTPLREALTVMHTKRVGSILVVSEAGALLGILTRYDVLDRVTLAGISLDTPISQVMTKEVKTLTVDHTAESAAVMMSRFEIRHIPIIDSRERVVGLISERDLFSLQRQSLGTISALIQQTDEVEGLRECASSIRKFARNLLGQGVSARQLTFLVSHLNDVLTARLITLAAKSHGLDLNAFVWMSLGSEGRSEQTIATDQDNALMYRQTDHPDEKKAYLAFAREVNDALDMCGYPLCKGNIMASNASLCLTVDEWKARFLHWIEHGYPDDLLKAGIFFDFRGLAGNVELLKGLREDVKTVAARTPRFIKLLADAALLNHVPLNWLGGLETKKLDGKSVIDLKLQGTAIVVETARIYALALGVEELNTQDRLAAIGRALGLPQTETDTWIAAFQFLQTLRLAIQIDREAIAGNPNALDVDSLNAVDRSILKESMARIRSLQQRLELDYVR
jgi:CBS domain-containing protein